MTKKYLPVGSVFEHNNAQYLIVATENQSAVVTVYGHFSGIIGASRFAREGMEEADFIAMFGSLVGITHRGESLTDYFYQTKPYSSGDIFYNDDDKQYYILSWFTGWTFVNLLTGSWYNSPICTNCADGLKLGTRFVMFVNIPKKQAFLTLANGV